MKEEKENTQKFYFNEEGELIVESNKGVIANGEHFVKMYGNFSCNARTMGIIIQRFVGVPVEIGSEGVTTYTKEEVIDEILKINKHTINHYCIIGYDNERIDTYVQYLAERNYTNKQIEEKDNEIKDKVNEINELWKTLNTYKKSHEELVDSISNLRLEIIKFNEMPWYKRLFKKIELDSVED